VLGQDHCIALTSHPNGGSSVTLYRGGEADKGFAGIGLFEFCEWSIDVHEEFSAWLDQIVLAQDP
jgi:hypothetical protein